MSAHRNKNNQGVERDRLFGLSGDGPKTEPEEKEGDAGGGGRDDGVTQITESPPSPTVGGWFW